MLFFSSLSALVLFHALFYFCLSALLCSPLFCAFLLIYTVLLFYSSVLTLGRNWTRVSITGNSLSPTMPSRHRALLAFGDVLGALLSLHSRCRTIKSRASKVEIFHLTAPTTGAFAALGFDPQLSQTAAHCFISLSYLPSLQQYYRNLTLIVCLYPWKKWRLDSLKNKSPQTIWGNWTHDQSNPSHRPIILSYSCWATELNFKSPVIIESTFSEAQRFHPTARAVLPDSCLVILEAVVTFFFLVLAFKNGIW